MTAFQDASMRRAAVPRMRARGVRVLAALGALACAACESGPRPVGPPSGPADAPPPPPPSAARPAAAPRALPERFPKALYASNPYLAIQIPPGMLEGFKGVELWVTDDDGETWSNYGYYDGRPSELKYLASRDGRYGFKLVLVDRDNNRSERPRRGTVPDYAVMVDTQAPLIAVASPNGGDVFRAGAQTLIAWTVVDANIEESSILIDYTTDDGQNWFPIAQSEANDGKYFWNLPMVTSSQCRVRIHAKDLAGNIGSAMSERTFTIDGLAPTIQIAGPPRSPTAKVSLAYAAADLGGAGLARVDLWMTKDNGLTWTRLGSDTDTASPFDVTLLDGEYGLKLTAVDRVGNASETPVPGSPPPSRIVVDTLDPEVRFLNFMAGEILAGGTSADILYAVGDANLGTEPVVLEYSADGGKTWNPITAKAKSEGPVAWTVPAVSGKAYHLRITARDLFNHETVAVSRPFTVDASVPEAVAIGPFESRGHRVDVQYEIRNIGFSPVKRVDVWRTTDGGNTWETIGSDLDLQPPYPVVLPSDGLYGLAVTCVTELGEKTGRRQPDPAKATLPQVTLAIDGTPPELRLRTFDKRHYVRGGDKALLAWEVKDAGDHLDPRGISLLYTINGGQAWLPIAEGLDASAGGYMWVTPSLNASALRVKAVARDTFGNVTEVVGAEDSVIDAYPPKGRLRGPTAVHSHDIQMAIEGEDVGDAGIRTVDIWMKDLGAKLGWERVLSRAWRAGDRIARLDVPQDGRYGFKLVLTDQAGNAMPAPTPDTGVAEHEEVLVDTRRPELTLRSPLGGADLRVDAGQELAIVWEAADDHFGANPIELRYTKDGGATWNEIAQEAPNTGRYAWVVPLEASDRCQVKVIARDLAGNDTEAVSPQFFRVAFPEPMIAVEREPAQPVFSLGRFNLAWRLVAGDLRPGSGRVEISADGLTWNTYQPIGLARNLTLHAPRDPGVYWLRVAGMNLGGAPVFSRPVSLTVVDNLRRPPQVRILKPEAGDLIEGGKVVPLYVRFDDPDNDVNEKTVRIEFSNDSGMNFQTVKQEDLQSINDGYNWKVPPITSDRCRLRVSVEDMTGLRAEDVSRQDFRVDSSVPEVVAVGPKAALPGPIPIDFKTPTALRSIHVWTSDETGTTWKKGPVVTLPTPPVILAPTPQSLGIFLVGENALNVRGEEPRPGTLPQLVIHVHEKEPIAVEFTGSWKEGPPLFVKGGAPVDITWRCAAQDLPALPVHLSAALNGSGSKPITPDGGVPNTGKYTWEPPLVDKAECRLTIVVRDAIGREGSAVSRTFVVASTPPNVGIEVLPDQAGGGQGGDGGATAPPEAPSPKDSGQGFNAPPARGSGADTEETARVAPPGAFLRLALAEGARLDGGDPSAPPQKNEASDAPGVVLRSPAGGECLKGGDVMPIRWEVRSVDVRADGIDLYFSPDAGHAWRPLASGLPNDGAHAWRIPEGLTADRLRVRLCAYDRQGKEWVADSPGEAVVDSMPPEGWLAGNQVMLYPDDVIQTAGLRDRGPAGLGGLELYVTEDGGKNWSLHQTYALGQALRLTTRSLRVGAYLVAIDRAGNASPRPYPGTPPQGVVRLLWPLATTDEKGIEDTTTAPNPPLEEKTPPPAAPPKEVKTAAPSQPSEQPSVVPTLEAKAAPATSPLEEKFPAFAATPQDVKTAAPPAPTQEAKVTSQAAPPHELPEDVREAIEKAREAKAKRDIGEAQHLIQTALTRHPDSAALHHQLGLVHIEFENALAARRSLQTAHAIDPEDPDILGDLALTYFMTADYETSRDLLTTALRIKDHPLCRMNLGVTLYNLGKREQALQELSRCVAVDDAQPRAHLYLGFLASERGDPAEARRHFERVVALAPGTTVARQARMQLTLLSSSR